MNESSASDVKAGLKYTDDRLLQSLNAHLGTYVMLALEKSIVCRCWQSANVLSSRYWMLWPWLANCMYSAVVLENVDCLTVLVDAVA